MQTSTLSHLYELTNDAANPGGSLVPFGEWGFESRRCQFSFVPFCRLQMGLERNCRDTVSPARPSSLLLEDNNNMLYGGHHDDNNSSSSDGLTADIMSEDSVTNAHNCRRQRRRKRAPYSWIKRFSGESLRGSNHSHFIYLWIKRFSGESLQGSNNSHSSRHTRGSNHSHFRYSWIKRFSGESLRGSNHSHSSHFVDQTTRFSQRTPGSNDSRVSHFVDQTILILVTSWIKPF